jgi:hypothetical protein
MEGLESTRITMNTDTAIATTLYLHQADYRALQACVEAGLQQLGLQQIDGVPVHKWIDKRRIAELEKILLSVGDKDPAAHNAVLACIAEISKNVRAA